MPIRYECDNCRRSEDATSTPGSFKISEPEGWLFGIRLDPSGEAKPVVMCTTCKPPSRALPTGLAQDPSDVSR